MSNRRLTSEEIAKVDAIQARAVSDLGAMARGDPELLFAARRRLFTRLMHLERGTPAQRTKLKAEKWKAQSGKCAMCKKGMPQKGSELDRFEAWKGYTAENTQLVHHDCHVEDQRRKGFNDAEVEIAEHLEELDAVASVRDEAEILSGDGWFRIDIERGLTLGGSTPMRCPACHGRVRAHKAGTTGQRAHFEHLRSHDGCPLKNGFSGEISAHPEALT